MSRGSTASYLVILLVCQLVPRHTSIIRGLPVYLQEAALVATERLRDVLTPEARKPPICQLPQPPSPVISSLTALGKIEQVVPCEE